ncbi:hypothetical protein TELCIR_06052 [Teladorsagia circumcincta]|uniref:Uncharacterized protein n=1 Tax=Teladorsagia circumcincta TaxID=45464 RepID=A0A2G9UP09_TELCI|nr:hypothetical protein TELCIR_06052 [Teladorsagia circumcincta]
MDGSEIKQKEKVSVFTYLQYGTTAAAAVLIMRSSNRFLTHAQRGKTIVGALVFLYGSLARWFYFPPFRSLKPRRKDMK